jgi:hypothetical protein
MAERKRRRRRFPIAASALVTFSSEEGDDSLEAVVANISFGGMGIYSRKTLGKGMPVLIELNFISSDGSIKTSFLEGVTVYDTRSLGSLWFVGIVFNKEVNPADQPLLHDHLEKVSGWE